MIAIITIFIIQNEGSRQGAFRLKPKAPGEVGDELLRQVTRTGILPAAIADEP